MILQYCGRCIIFFTNKFNIVLSEFYFTPVSSVLSMVFTEQRGQISKRIPEELFFNYPLGQRQM